MAINNNISEYKQINNYTGVTDANPHQLVKMLLEGASAKLSIAKGMMSRGEMTRKGEVISQAMAIISGLQASLDMSAGGDIAQNLDSLYDYMVRRLMQANIDNDVEIVSEVLILLKEIETAWDGIPTDLRVGNSEPMVATAE